MTDNSLNNQMFADIHKNLLDNINLQAVADEFVKASKTQINYFELNYPCSILQMTSYLDLKGHSCLFLFILFLYLSS